MKTIKIKKFASLLLAVLMLFTMIPTAVFSMEEKKELPMIEAYSSASAGDFHAYFNKIYSVTFTDKIDDDAVAACAPLAWDVSAEDDGGVMAWMIKNEEQTTKAGADRYDLYIGGDGGVAANPNSSWIFYIFNVLEEVRGCENFHTDEATTFYAMFYNCYKLRSVTGINWNISEHTNNPAKNIDTVAARIIDETMFAE